MHLSVSVWLPDEGESTIAEIVGAALDATVTFADMFKVEIVVLFCAITWQDQLAPYERLPDVRFETIVAVLFGTLSIVPASPV